MMNRKNHLLGQKKHPIILGVMATASLAVIIVPFTGSKSLAAMVPLGTKAAARATVSVVGVQATPTSTPTPAPSGTSLSYIPGSSVKLEQIIGDCDW